MDGRFSGKVVTVTGGGSGIGAAAALRFAAEGARVVIAGRTEEKLKAVAERSPSVGAIDIRVVDVANEDAVTHLVDEVADTYRRLDVLVNNAGIAHRGRAEDTTTASWREVMAVDLDAVFFASRAAMKHLRAVGGSIVNVGSVSGLGGDWSTVAYNAAKGAVANLTRAMAVDHGAEGVRVNAVSPSLTVTDITEPFRAIPGVNEKFAERIPMGRAATADEVGDVIVFLASPDARFVNGVNLPVDGGLTASSGLPRVDPADSVG